MIKDSQAWEKWEKENSAKQPVDLALNLRLLESLLQEARALGVFPLSQPLQDLEVKIHLAKVINVSKAS